MRINYRPEIDGLKAVAVCSIILYHIQISFFQFQIFKGGFIGIDIFFVISGYLITLIILEELVNTGNFSFKNFYLRRIRRIIPTLLFVFLVSIPFAWLYLLPNGFLDFSKSILYSLGLSSNFYFWSEGVQFFNLIARLKPFYHTWSLSVLEQFYFFFPLIVIFFIKKLKNYIFFLILLSLSIILFISNWLASNLPSFNFYFFIRVSEFFFGSILAYLEIKNNSRCQNKFLNGLLPSVGLFLILSSIFFINDEISYSFFYTLFPIIGVCLLIWFCNKNEIITKILSSKLFVCIGLISYSLYLWHYPIYAFARNRGKILSDYDKFELFLLTLCFSILSFFLIEKPFRKKNFLSSKILLILLTLFIVFFSFFGFFSLRSNGFDDRIHVFLKNELRTNYHERMVSPIDKTFCFNKVENFCSFNSENEKKIFLIGDSHMEHISENLLKKIKDRNVNYISMNRANCIYLPNFSKINKKTKKKEENCTIQSQFLIKKNILKNKNSIVILGGYFYDYFLRKDFKWSYQNESNLNALDGFVNGINELLLNDINVFLVYPIPKVGWHVPRRLMNEIPKSSFNASKFLSKNQFTTEFADYHNNNKLIIETFDKIDHPNLTKIYPHKVFCDAHETGKCYTHDKKNIFYMDPSHLSHRGSEMLIDEIDKYLYKLTN